MQGAIQEVVFGFMDLYQSIGSLGQPSSRHQDYPVDVHTMDTLHSRDHAVHPGKGLLVRAVWLLLGYDHHSLLLQHSDREDSNPALVDEGMRLHCHHRGDEVLRVVSASSNGDKALQCATDEDQTTSTHKTKEATTNIEASGGWLLTIIERLHPNAYETYSN